MLIWLVLFQNWYIYYHDDLIYINFDEPNDKFSISLTNVVHGLHIASCSLMHFSIDHNSS